MLLGGREKLLGGVDNVGGSEAGGSDVGGALVAGALVGGATVVAGTVGPHPTTGGFGLGVKIGGPTGIGGAARFAPVSQSQHEANEAWARLKASTSAAETVSIFLVDNDNIFISRSSDERTSAKLEPNSRGATKFYAQT